MDPEGLYVLGTVVVDYRGYRVTAQSIIPGILERDQEQSVVYGSIDFGKTVVASQKYQELVKILKDTAYFCVYVYDDYRLFFFSVRKACSTIKTPSAQVRVPLMKLAYAVLKNFLLRVKSVNGDVVKLQSSVESKGIIGNDSRHYILDLLRTFPPDVHYLPGTFFFPISHLFRIHFKTLFYHSRMRSERS